MIKFVVITKKNCREYLHLRVAARQRHFVESVRQSLEEAWGNPQWEPVGIYADEILIGFAMYGFWENEGSCGRVWLDRYLIDERYQGKGYGRCCLTALISHITSIYRTREIYLSVYEENQQAVKLYQSAGFCFNGELDVHGEKIMVLFI